MYAEYKNYIIIQRVKLEVEWSVIDDNLTDQKQNIINASFIELLMQSLAKLDVLLQMRL